MPDRDDTTPGRFNRRKVLLGLGLAAASGLAQARQPAPNRPRIATAKLKAMMPDAIGEYRFDAVSGLVLPPSDALSDRLYDNLITRVYGSVRGSPPIMILMAYNNRQDGVLQLHRPEICYPAGGYTLSETQLIDVPVAAGTLPARIFSAQSETRNEVVLYWTRIGSAFPRQWAEQRVAVARDNLRGVIPDGILVRVSTLGNDVAAASPALETFIAELYRSSPSPLRQLLFDRS